jgi:two-component system sensor histidine kinase KdpD
MEEDHSDVDPPRKVLPKKQQPGCPEIKPVAERILVCIGANPRSVCLIRTARHMSTDLGCDWLAVTVEAPVKVRPSAQDLLQLAEHMQLAESLGAETLILAGQRVSEELLNYARSCNVTRIIIGKPTHPRWKDRLFGSVLDEVVRGSGQIDVYVITGASSEMAPRPVLKPLRQAQPVDLRHWLLSLANVALSSVLAALMYPHFTLVDLAMVYLLGIMLTASRLDRGPTLLTTLLSIAAFNFLFIPPLYTFSVEDARYLVTFAVMFTVALVISRLTWQVREQAARARQRERRTAALYHLSRELAHAEGRERLSAIAIRHLSEVFSCQAVIFVPDDQGLLTPAGSGRHCFALDQQEQSVAQWAFEQRQKAGLGTNRRPGAKALYLPLVAAAKTIGVVGLLPGNATAPFTPDQVHALESFSNQIAMALERAFLAEETQRARLKIETEALRNTLLSSVSHDLRTPLAAITGAGTTLLQSEKLLDAENRRELVQTIVEESAHLNRIIRNVLDMTRLESGGIQVQREWQSLEEIVGAVTNRSAGQFQTHPLHIHLPANLPLIHCDELLIEQVLRNLLENALKYSPGGSDISLSARVKHQEVQVRVADRGPGVPPEERARIFEKFVRGKHLGGGAGLGLAICQGIVAIHGGRIWMENLPEGGSAFTFSLPISQEPPSIEEEADENLP